MTGSLSFFTVMVTGEVESSEIPGQSNAYCKYQLVHGEDWQLLSGIEDGISQTSRCGRVPGTACGLARMTLHLLRVARPPHAQRRTVGENHGLSLHEPDAHRA